MDVNALSILEDTSSALMNTGGEFSEVLPASLLPNVDFDALLADVTEVANAAVDDIEQAIESTTELVTDTLENLGIDADIVDVSGIVEEVVNFIASLPEEATLTDTLNEIVEFFEVEVPALSSEDLLALLNDVSELINELAPGLDQISIGSALDDGVELVDELTESIGTITIDGTSISGELVLNGETNQFTTDLSDELDDLLAEVNAFLTGIDGSVSLDGGQFTGVVTIDEVEYALEFDLTQALAGGLTSLLTSIDTTVPFTNGIIAINTTTPFGDIDGTIDFVDGDLDIDLETPFGAVVTSFDFPQNTQFSVPTGAGGTELTVDLATSILSLEILNFSTIEAPLSSLSGELGLADGLATISVDSLGELAFENGIETTFEIGPLVSELAVELTEDLLGEATITAGEFIGFINTRFGGVDFTASLGELVLQASALIDETTGMLSLNEGLASIVLDTPLGDLAGGISLLPLEESLVEVSSSLV